MKNNPLLLLVFLLLQQTSHAFAPYDGSEIIDRMSMYNHMPSATEMVGGSFETDDYARVINVPQKGERVMDVSLSIKNRDIIKEGDPIIVRLTADGEAHSGGAAQLHFKLQVNENPWPTLSGRNQALTSDPETYELVFTADRDYYPGEVGFVIFAGQQAQTIRLRSLKIYAGAEAVSQASTGETVLYDIDFEGDYKTVSALEGSLATISGSIPVELTEDTSWANVDVVYTPVSEGVFAGEQSLRVEVSDVQSGYAQLRIDQFPSSSEHYLRLNFAVKSTSMSPFTVAIRENTIPFRKYWQTTVTGAPEWKEINALIPPLPDDSDSEFIIELTRPGLTEFDNISIVSMPRELVEQGSELEGNLLINSSFPFGFQRPWRGYTGSNNGLAHLTDSNVIGPTGQPALKILGQDEHEFIRLPFQGKPGNKHTVSFWARAGVEGTWVTPRIGPPSEKLYIGDWGSTHTLGTDWRRVSHTVELPFHADGFYELQIYMHTTDTIWFDGLMVEVADEVREFQRVAPVELTVIPTHGSENIHSLFFKGEPISLNVGLIGERPEGSRLLVETEPFGYDVEAVTSELPVTGSENREIKVDIPFDLLGLPEFGTAYVRFQVVDAEGKELSKLYESTVHVVREPRGWGQFIHDSPFDLLGLPEFGTAYVRFQVVDAEGKELSKLYESTVHVVREPRGWGQFIHDSPFGTHVAPNEGMITTAKRLGFNWVRSFQMGWRKIQPEEGGPWNWERMDELVGWWRKNHLEVLGIYGHTPRWASMTGGSNVPGAGWKNNLFGVPDEHLDDWAEYAAQLSSRYEDVIRVYETWNEPFLPGFFLKDFQDGQSIHADPETLYKMSKAVRDRLEADSIDVELAWNFGPHYPDGDGFDRRSAELGMFDLHDVVTYHSYERNLGGYPGDPYETMIKRIQEFMAEFGKPDKTLWNSESGPGGGHQHNIYPTIPIANMSGMQQHYSKYISRAWNAMLANGVERNFIYFLNDGGFWRGNYDLMQPDGSLSPNLVSFSNLAWHIEGKEFVEIIPLSETFHAYVYEGPVGVTVSMVPQDIGILSLTEAPADWRLSDLFGNRLTSDEARSDFWIHAEGAKASDVIAWLKEHWGQE